MRPKNKLEKIVLDMAEKLPIISDTKKKWAFGLFPINGFYQNNGEVWCQYCGFLDKVSKSELAVSLENDYHICPNCGRCLQMIKVHPGEHYNKEKYVSFIQTFKGWNVIRTFKAERINNEKGERTKYLINEVYQNWIDDDGKEIIVTRPYSRSPFHLSWKIWEPMTIGHHNYNASGSYEMEDMFDTEGNYFYSRAMVTDVLKRNGWRNDFIKRGIPVTKSMIQLLTNPTAETIVKQGQIDVFKYMLKRGDRQLPYMYALNICHRNGYIINDASMWFDYMDLLSEFHLDTHNARYVCPTDLKHKHDRLMVKKQKIEEQKTLEQKENENRKYRREKQAFLGLCFEGDGIIVSVLQSVKDFYEEGEAMHHCVYSNGYYKKKNSLILSAKKDGKRIETIEVNLKTFKIIQSRAVCNQTSEYHNSIIELVNRNMGLIRRAAS